MAYFKIYSFGSAPGLNTNMMGVDLSEEANTSSIKVIGLIEYYFPKFDSTYYLIALTNNCGLNSFININY